MKPVATRFDIANAGKRHVIAHKWDLVSGHHIKHPAPCCGGLGLVTVKAHFPIGIGQLPDIVVGEIGPKHQLLTFAF